MIFFPHLDSKSFKQYDKLRSSEPGAKYPFERDQVPQSIFLENETAQLLKYILRFSSSKFSPSEAIKIQKDRIEQMNQYNALAGVELSYHSMVNMLLIHSLAPTHHRVPFLFSDWVTLGSVLQKCCSQMDGT